MHAVKKELQSKVKTDEKATSMYIDASVELTKIDWDPLSNHITHLNQRLDFVEQTFSVQLYELKQKFIQEKKKRNVMFYKIPYNDTESKEELAVKVCHFVYCMLNMVITLSDIDFVLRVGTGFEPRPVRVTFASNMKKHQILSNARKLKQLRNCIVHVSDDFPSHVAKIRKGLYRYMVKARSNGFLAKLKYDKLIINSVSYSLDFLEQVWPLNEFSE